jgi:hypothetical protein
VNGTGIGMRFTGRSLIATATLCSCGGLARPDVPQPPPASDVETTVYLIGDAGVPALGGDPVLQALTEDVADAAAAATPIILFLGDNIYPRGMPDSSAPNRADAERRLAAQIEVAVETGAGTIFIPGNHDWDFAGAPNHERVLRAAQYGEAIGEGFVHFLPAGACPGPQIVDIDTQVRLVILDTQWWLNPQPLTNIPEYCSTQDRGEVLDSMRVAISSAGDRHVIVAGHHPLQSGGVHGGYFTLGQHLFPLREKYSWAWIPLPALGSVYPVARRMGVSDQDLAGPRNRSMRLAFDSVFSEHVPLIYAAGHEHTLQIIAAEGPPYHVVSGTGNWGHVSAVRQLPGTLFAASTGGYVRLDFGRDGRVRLGVIVVDRSSERHEAFSMYLE